MDMPSRLLVRLSRRSKQASNEPGLLAAVSFAHPLHLPLSDPRQHLLPVEGSPGRFKREEAEPWLDEAFDEPVILLHHVVEVLNLPQFTRDWNGPCGLELAERLGVRRIFVHSDDAGRDGVRRHERL